MVPQLCCCHLLLRLAYQLVSRAFASTFHTLRQRHLADISSCCCCPVFAYCACSSTLQACGWSEARGDAYRHNTTMCMSGVHCKLIVKDLTSDTCVCRYRCCCCAALRTAPAVPPRHHGREPAAAALLDRGPPGFLHHQRHHANGGLSGSVHAHTSGVIRYGDSVRTASAFNIEKAHVQWHMQAHPSLMEL